MTLVFLNIDYCSRFKLLSANPTKTFHLVMLSIRLVKLSNHLVKSVRQVAKTPRYVINLMVQTSNLMLCCVVL